MSKAALARRIGAFSALTLAEIALGVAIAHPVAGMVGGDLGGGGFPTWLWPAFCIVGLTLIWLSTARSLVIRPIRDRRSDLAHRDHFDPAVSTIRRAQGWYHDPYRIHQYRWFSKGKPSALVRDGGTESNDSPPGIPYVGSLVPEEIDESLNANGADLQRAGDRQPRDVWEVAADASTWFPLN